MYTEAIARVNRHRREIHRRRVAAKKAAQNRKQQRAMKAATRNLATV